MNNKINIYCPLIDLPNDEVSQIVRPGIMNSDKCELSQIPWKPHEYKKWKESPESTSYPDPDVILIHGSGNLDLFQECVDRFPKKPVIVLDYKDIPDHLHHIIKHNNVTYFKRSMVELHRGNPIKVITYDPHKVHFTAFCVREDILEASNRMMNNERDIDVSCFFDGDTDKDITQIHTHMFAFKDENCHQARGHAPKAIKMLSDIKSHVGKTAKVCQNLGRQGVDLDKPGSMQYNYVELMSRSKIIVTACPPNYEGDYRLMEAMTSGAMVIHNKMLLPPPGLIDGIHWVTYDNPIELVEKITFYNRYPQLAQQIADKGRAFVLENHRPHHRVEQWLQQIKLLK